MGSGRGCLEGKFGVKLKGLGETQARGEGQGAWNTSALIWKLIRRNKTSTRRRKLNRFPGGAYDHDPDLSRTCWRLPSGGVVLCSRESDPDLS